jgi:hypothetical protein
MVFRLTGGPSLRFAASSVISRTLHRPRPLPAADCKPWLPTELNMRTVIASYNSLSGRKDTGS